MLCSVLNSSVGFNARICFPRRPVLQSRHVGPHLKTVVPFRAFSLSTAAVGRLLTPEEWSPHDKPTSLDGALEE